MPPRPQFSGHETFALRAGWPKKAYDAAREDAGIFPCFLWRCPPQYQERAYRDSG